MTKTLDVYRDWLKISETARPLNHYQLLRLKKFEDDPAKVREHYRAMNAHVRKFATGEFATQSQELLNELAKAMLCLTDARRKGEYDASMGRADAGATGKARTFEQILLATKVIDQAALDKARNFAKAINVEVRDALVQQKLAKYEAVLPAYAESIGLPYLDLTDIPLDASLIARVPPILARTHSCVPVLVDNKQLLMASPNPLDPNVEEELRLRFDMPVRTVLCTPANINDAISKFVPRDGSMPEPTPVAAAPTPAPTQTAAAPAAAAPKKAARPPGPMTPEERKERFQYTMLAVGMSTIVVMNSLYTMLGYGVILSAIATLVVAGIAGWITWTKKTA
jgi:hypothetical protein